MSEESKAKRQPLRARVAELEAELVKVTTEREVAIRERDRYQKQLSAVVAAFDQVSNFAESRKILAIEMMATSGK